MKIVYRHSERVFEKHTSIANAILGNSLTFIVTLCTLVFCLTNKRPMALKEIGE